MRQVRPGSDCLDERVDAGRKRLLLDLAELFEDLLLAQRGDLFCNRCETFTDRGRDAERQLIDEDDPDPLPDKFVDLARLKRHISLLHVPVDEPPALVAQVGHQLHVRGDRQGRSPGIDADAPGDEPPYLRVLGRKEEGCAFRFVARKAVDEGPVAQAGDQHPGKRVTCNLNFGFEVRRLLVLELLLRHERSADALLCPFERHTSLAA